MSERTGKTNHIQFIGLIIIIFLAVEDFFLIQQNRQLKAELSPPAMESLRAGDTVGSFKIKWLDGTVNQIRFDDTAKPYLLFVLSPSCPHCRNNVDRWNDIVLHNQINHCSILGISVQSVERTRVFRDSANVGFDLAVAADTSFSRKYKIHAFPQTILVGGSGRIEKVWMGELNNEQINEIERLLNRSVHG